MTGIVDVGGGLRGAFSAGLCDRFLETGVKFDLCIGVSAGSANLISYTSQNDGRLKRFYLNYTMRKEYMGFGNLIKTGSYVGLDYIYSTLSTEGGEDPMDFDTFFTTATDFVAVTTFAESGKAVYFDKSAFGQNDLTPIKASCCIPIACKPISIDGHDYFDGGLSDPIPFKKAFEMGCDKVVVVISRPKEYRKSKQKLLPIIKAALKKYPEVYKAISVRHEVYNRQLEEALELEKQGKVLILAPKDCYGVNTLTRNPESLEKLYNEGVSCANRNLDALRAFCAAERR